jgi:hypothetical protein
MSIYSQIYYNLISRNVNKKDLWESKVGGLHRHHIKPKHSGGEDVEYNYTYLTVREHIAAHWLLWKIHGNVNDLRSMYMLGGNLTAAQRKATGEYCRDNGIGFFNEKWDSYRSEWRNNGVKTQIENNIGIHNPDDFAKHASLGGKASIVSPNNPWSYWASAEGRRVRAQMGAQSHKGKKTMYIPGDATFIRVKPCDFQSYIDKGYIFGSPIVCPNGGYMKGKPSPNRKSVFYNGVQYDSMQAACDATGLKYHQLRAKLSLP